MRPRPVELPTTAVVECAVRGCGWRAEIPTLYRLEYGLEPGSAFVSTRVVVDEPAVAAFDAYLAGHLVQHEVAETLIGEQNPPGSALEAVYRATECRLHPDDPGPAPGYRLSRRVQ